MNILSPYHNAAGKISSNNPSLFTENFFVENLFKHSFDDIAHEKNINEYFRWSQNENGIFMSVVDGEVLNPTDVHPKGFNPAEVWSAFSEYFYNGKYYFTDGLFGRRGIRPTPLTGVQGLARAYLYTQELGAISGDSIRFRVVAKSPMQTSKTDDDAGIMLMVKCDEFIDIELYIHNLGNYGYISTLIINGDGDSGSYSLPWENRYITVDGRWHAYDLTIHKGEPYTLSVDGTIIGRPDSSPYFDGVLSNAFVAGYMVTADEAVNYTLDSISIESI